MSLIMALSQIGFFNPIIYVQIESLMGMCLYEIVIVSTYDYSMQCRSKACVNLQNIQQTATLRCKENKMSSNDIWANYRNAMCQ